MLVSSAMRRGDVLTWFKLVRGENAATCCHGGAEEKEEKQNRLLRKKDTLEPGS